MQYLPDLHQLSHAQKDELIVRLWPLIGQVQELLARVDSMQKVIDDLQGHLALNSKNSSKPPCSDGLNKPRPKSLRIAGQRPTGGQKGHPGSTLRQVTTPEDIVTHDVPSRCQACQHPLDFAYVGETRQIFELPALRFKVTEHRAMQAICRCGQVHSAEFPAGGQCNRAIRPCGPGSDGASESKPRCAATAHSRLDEAALWPAGQPSGCAQGQSGGQRCATAHSTAHRASLRECAGGQC